MNDFIFYCPVCDSELADAGKSLICENRHCFDKAAAGYVNLFMNNASSLKRHGDDKTMVISRRDFLDKGFYEPLKTELVKVVNDSFLQGAKILDVGCGEGYYTEGFANEKYIVGGVDISKDALKYAAKRCKGVSFAVASAFSLPVGEGMLDGIVNVFAPCAYEEFYRVLSPKGLLIKAVPLEDHLFGMKEALYAEPRKNKPELTDENLFTKVSESVLKYEITLCEKTDIMNLFSMTPYYYKTSREDTLKLQLLSSLKTTVHFNIETYKKREQNV